jgi:PIN domain nuclease of toxin-antitoxin system
VRLLLDTHAFIWWRESDRRLTPAIRETVRDADVVFVSMASAWEIAIKMAVGKIRLEASVEAGIAESYFEPLPIEFRHTEKVAALPLHHRDPFDRMLIAQCLVENLTLVTADRRLEPYGVPALWI